jgi:hypothetical protein
LLIHRRVQDLHVIHRINESYASLKFQAGQSLIKVMEIIYPQAMTLRLLLSTGPTQAKLAYLVVMMAGTCFKSAQMKRLLYNANK